MRSAARRPVHFPRTGHTHIFTKKAPRRIDDSTVMQRDQEQGTNKYQDFEARVTAELIATIFRHETEILCAGVSNCYASGNTKRPCGSAFIAENSFCLWLRTTLCHVDNMTLSCVPLNDVSLKPTSPHHRNNQDSGAFDHKNCTFPLAKKFAIHRGHSRHFNV